MVQMMRGSVVLRAKELLLPSPIRGLILGTQILTELKLGLPIHAQIGAIGQ